MTGRHKETGRYAYEAYAAAVGYRNYQGGVMPQWDDPSFPEQIRNAWREAAHAVIRYGWQQHDAPPDLPGEWEHAGSWRPGTAWDGDDDGPETRTSHRIR